MKIESEKIRIKPEWIARFAPSKSGVAFVLVSSILWGRFLNTLQRSNDSKSGKFKG